MTRTIALVSLLAAGCTAGAGRPSDISLAQADQVVATAVDHATFQATAKGGLSQDPQQVSFDIQGLTLQVHSGDRPELTTFDLPIGDLDVPASALPPHGLKLRDVALHVEKPVAAEVLHAQDDALDLHVRAPLTLSWRMLLDDGSTWALGPTRTEPVDLDLHVLRSDSGFLATVDAHCDGECWSLNGIASLRDARIYVEAKADVQPMQ